MDNESVVAKLDNTLDYLYIDKYGIISEFDLSKTKFQRSTKKLFECCDDRQNEIMELGIAEKDFLMDNGVRLTFITGKGIFSTFGTFTEMEKTEILGRTIVHFANLVDLKKY